MNWIKPSKHVVPWDEVSLTKQHDEDTVKVTTCIINLDLVKYLYTIDNKPEAFLKENYRIVFNYGTDDSEIHWYYLNKEARDRDYAILLNTLEASFISIG